MTPLFIPISIPIVLLVVVLICLARSFGSGRCCRSPLRIFLIILLIVAAMKFVHWRPQFNLPAVAVSKPALVLASAPLRSIPPRPAPATQISRLWTEDWTAFANATRWCGFRAESSDTAVTEAESRQEAIADAARTLAANIGGNAPGLTDQISARLRSGELIADQMIQRTEKSYGTLWKTYLLIDTSPPAPDQIMRQYNAEMLAQRQNWIWTAGSMAAMMLIIVLLYAFLNAVTKGYFMWRLRAAAIMAAIVAVLVLVTVI